MKVCLALLVASLACLSPTVQPASIEDSHIIGGLPGHSLETPYVSQLRLRKNGRTERYCGATRLNEEWFITAAECLNKTLYDEVRLTYPTLLGQETDFEDTDFEFSNLQYRLYPEYNPETKVHNIALIKCDSCSPTDFARMAALPGRNVSGPLSFKDAIVSGWSIAEANAKKGTIRTVEAMVLHPFICKLLHLFRLNTDTMICTTGMVDQNVSEDDVGGPLSLLRGYSRSEVILIGITTSSRPWSIYSRPMVFTKLYPYMPWVYNQTGITPVDAN